MSKENARFFNDSKKVVLAEKSIDGSLSNDGTEDSKLTV